MVIRNNLFDDSAASGATAIIYEQRNSYVPAPNDIRICNNTLYESSGTATFLQTNSTATNLRVRNNLVAAPSGGTLFNGAGGTGWVQDHNLVTTASPTTVFTNAAGGDFSLQAGSPAADVGTVLPEVREDFSRRARPLGAAYDVGASER